MGEHGGSRRHPAYVCLLAGRRHCKPAFTPLVLGLQPDEPTFSADCSLTPNMTTGDSCARPKGAKRLDVPASFRYEGPMPARLKRLLRLLTEKRQRQIGEADAWDECKQQQRPQGGRLGVEQIIVKKAESMRGRDIKVGKCYRTPTNQVRYVLRITAHEVAYVPRGQHRPKPGWWKKGDRRKTSVERFAQAVIERVNWYWDPDYPTPTKSGAGKTASLRRRRKRDIRKARRGK
jgi:hypothetical protein